ncbi:MAG: hypothetical protein Q8P89_03855 [bacterium]|nr:hypothetical protein [bacterium]
MGIESLAGGAVGALGEAVGSGLSSTASGIEAASGAVGALSGGIESSLSPGLLIGLDAPFGGLGSPASEVVSPNAFRSIFNFGPEHKAASGIFSLDKPVSPPESVFDDRLFTTLEISPFEGLFGPKIESLKSPINEGPVSKQESIFNENFFETLVKVENTALEHSIETVTESQVQPGNPSLTEIFGPQIGPVSPPVVESPVSRAENIFNQNLFEALVKVENRQVAEVAKKTAAEIIFPVKSAEVKIISPELISEPIAPVVLPDIYDEGVSLQITDNPKTKKEKTDGITAKLGNITVAEPTILEIIFGETVRAKPDQLRVEQETDKVVETAILGKSEFPAESEIETETFVSTPAVLAEGAKGDGEILVGTDKDQPPEEPEEPKEPLWKVSGKRPETDAPDANVLKRRCQVAGEIVLDAVSQSRDKNSFLSAVRTRLRRIDIPTVKEAVRMILGDLTFPFVAKQAEYGVLTNSSDSNPAKILKLLQEVLVRKPPIKPEGGGMGDLGLLPQSQLEKLAKEPAVLARQGAKHIVYDQRRGWKKVAIKILNHTLELDKTKKTTGGVDTSLSPWYTDFAKRAEARAKRKAKSQ